LLNYLDSFLISPGKTGTSQTNGYNCFVRVHYQHDMVVSKITIISADVGNLSEKVVKFAFRKNC
jgi:hypothetical protein